MSDYKITSITKPTIKLDQIQIYERSQGSKSAQKGLQDTDDVTTGLYVPLLVINGLPLEVGLLYFSLDVNGRMPLLQFRYRMKTSVFIGISYPKDGDVVSLYLASAVDVYKPIRMDFNVLSVQSTPQRKTDSDGGDAEIEFFIMAEPRIPTLYSARCKSFNMKSSYETLTQVSKDLELGISTNDTDLRDMMTWICPNISYLEFIDDVVEHAYKDDESFFEYWIDPYYNINFVNLALAFNQIEVVSEKVMMIPGSNKYLPDTQNPSKKSVAIEYDLLLTNYPGFDEYNTHIKSYTLLSNAGQNTNATGYVQNIIYYDQNSTEEDIEKRFVQYDIEATTIHNPGPDQILQKGRPREFIYREEKRKTWMGVLNRLPIGNVHPNFFHANAQNRMNIFDATKFILQVELDGYFPGIYKGQVVPVSIYTFESGVRAENTGKSDNASPQKKKTPLLDIFLSGNYVVMGYEICYSSDGGIIHVLNLCKRVWELNTAGSLPKAYPVNFKNTVQ